MKHGLTTLASLTCAAGLAMIIVGTAPAQAAGPTSAMNNARASLVPLVTHSTVESLEQATFRERRRGYRRAFRDRRFRHRRGGPTIYFHFGPRAPYYVPPPYYIPPPRRYAHHLPAAHIRWCQNRFRSYRIWDNSFQPYHGPRRQCNSPYFRAY